MKPILPIGLIAALCTAQAHAVNPVPGWYVGMLGEVSYAPDINFNISNPFTNAPISSQLSYRIMGGGGGQLGYRINCIRIELEALFNTNEYDKLTFGPFTIERSNSNNSKSGFSLNGRTNIMAGLFNVFYDFVSPGADANFVPYLGIGAGYASVQNRIVFYFNDVEIDGTRFSATKGGAVGQVIIGGSYFLDDFTSFNLDYRYLTTNTIQEFDKRFQLHTINISMNFAFDC